MNRRSCGTVTACIGVSIALLVFPLYLSSATNFTRVQVLKRWGMKSRVAPPQSTVVIICNRTHASYDLCSIRGPTLLDPTISALFLVNQSTVPGAPGGGDGGSGSSLHSLKVRPYTRKDDAIAMSKVTEMTLTAARPNTSCRVTHGGPALVFSAGGYTGNFFHEFNDGLIPLFITVNSLFPNRNVHFVVADCPAWWPRKYKEVIASLSRHPIIDLHRENVTHCFSSATVGLVSHGPMTVNPELMHPGHPITLLHFSAFLEKVYGQTPAQHWSGLSRPKLVLVSRSRRVGRSILNQAKLLVLAKRIGFDVTLFKPDSRTSLSHAFQLIHNSHAMVGVHGAGLTHAMFLRPGSVLVQVVPVATEWVSKTFFGKPAKALGLKYLEYKIEPKESSLAKSFGMDSVIMKNPKEFTRGSWSNMNLYLKDQNVKLDLTRFSVVLEKAYVMAKRFMEEENEGDHSDDRLKLVSNTRK